MRFHLALAAAIAVVFLSGCASRPLMPWRSNAEAPPTYVGEGLPSQFAEPSAIAQRYETGQEYDLVSLRRSREMARARRAPSMPSGCSGGC
mgnify:CR=1 FL=1